MLNIKHIALAALIMTLTAVRADEKPSNKLKIDNELFSNSLIDAHGKATPNRTEYCPPISDPLVLDRFIDDVLVARQSQVYEISSRDAALKNKLQPIQNEIEKIKRYLAKHSRKSRRADVYKRQISRLEAEIKLVSSQISEAYEHRTRYSIESKGSTDYLKTVSEKDKLQLAKMEKFKGIYTKRLRDEISYGMIKERYEELVQQKDERLVNVYIFSYRGAFILSNDAQTISNVTEYLKDEPTIGDQMPRRNLDGSIVRTVSYPANMLISAYTMNGYPQLSRLKEFLDLVGENPASIHAGSTLVSEPLKRNGKNMGGENHDVFHMVHILDKIFYPVIDINADTPYSRQILSTIKNELFENRLEKEVTQLRARSHTTRNSQVIVESEGYAECPKK